MHERCNVYSFVVELQSEVKDVFFSFRWECEVQHGVQKVMRAHHNENRINNWGEDRQKILEVRHFTKF